MRVNTFDIDGVIYFGEELKGVHPGPDDFIITGRSYEETDKTLKFLRERGINNIVFFNPLPCSEKSRLTSGQHKAKVIRELIEEGWDIGIHFEDDEIQIEEIHKELPNLRIVHLVSDIVEK